MGAVIPLYVWVATTAAIALFFVLVAIFWVIRSRGKRRDELILERLGIQEDLPESGGIRIRDAAGERHGVVGALPTVQRIQTVLTRAEIKAPAGRFLGLSGVLVLFVGLIASMASNTLVALPIVGVAVALVIHTLVMRKHNARVKQVVDQLPAAMEMMMFSMRAGHNLEEAIRTAAEEVDEPLAGELGRCYQEYTMGRPIEASLQQMWQRWEPARALGTFVEAVLVLKRTGGSLLEVMERLVENLRAQSAFEARHRALTAEGRMSGLFLMALPLMALLIQLLMVPEQLLKMMRDSTGQTLLLTSLGLWGLGILWVRRLVRPNA